MKNAVRIAAVALLAASAAACTKQQIDQFQARLERIHVFATTYGPVIGRDLIMVADVIVQAECSPALSPVTQASANILSIVAPNSSGAAKVKSVLQSNLDVAAQLCPLVASIKTSVGPVPAGTPTQIVPAAGS